MSDWKYKRDFDINKAVAEKHLNCGFRFDRLGRVHKGVDKQGQSRYN